MFYICTFRPLIAGRQKIISPRHSVKNTENAITIARQYGNMYPRRNYVDISNGVFEEVHTTKPIEKFNRTIFDTKTKKIKSFENIDVLYNNYNFDPVVFALSVAKYPGISPYAFVANNPIIAIDPDGRDIYIVAKDGVVKAGSTMDKFNTEMKQVIKEDKTEVKEDEKK